MRAEARGDDFEPVPRPRFPTLYPLTLESCRDAFEGARAFTIGVEEELMILDRSTLSPRPPDDDLHEFIASAPELHREMSEPCVEIVSPTVERAADVADFLADRRRRLVGASPALTVGASGTHPIGPEEMPLSRGPRYDPIAEEYQWAIRRNCVFGYHVHVAVPGAERTLHVFNALRSYLPHITALSANSPFYAGRDTGMAAVRPKILESVPRSGIPPLLPNWEVFLDYLAWGARSHSFPDYTHIWWDLRPHPVLATLEVRVSDVQTSVEDAVALAALVRALVAMLAQRYDEYRALPTDESLRIQENRWRAIRWGLSGFFVDLETGEQHAIRDALLRLIDDVEPFAERLGDTDELARARVLVAGNGADHQRRVAGRAGMGGLVDWIVARTAPPARP